MEDNQLRPRLSRGRYKLEFNDPYSEESRRLKKSLLVMCLITIAVSTFNLKFSSYDGFSAQLPEGEVGTMLLASFFLLISTYLAISFSFHAFIDYLAWNAGSELIELSSFDHYLESTNHFNDTLNTLLKGALNKTIPSGLEDFITKFDELYEIAIGGNSIETSKSLNYQLTELLPLLRSQATDIIIRQEVIKENIGTLINKHDSTSEQNLQIINYVAEISKRLRRLGPRIILRRIYFYFIDAIVPVGIYCFAFYKGYEGVPILMASLFGYGAEL